ncbi:MAG: inositol monophosphatase [Betaproteobacteria bacterium]|nr:MAG: inositol monophosphatase [Betaproteobacteria bacterium]
MSDTMPPSISLRYCLDMSTITQAVSNLVKPRISLAQALAGESNEMIRSAMARRDHVLNEKSANDFATDTDAAIESHIATRIAQLFPGDTLLGEEGGERVLGGRTASGVRWIVDPLDGTYNFIHGFPYVACSIAIEINGSIHAGVIGAPLQDELFVAVRNGGAWLHRGAATPQRLSVSDCNSLERALIGSVLPSASATSFDRVLPAWTAVARGAGSIRRTGAAALDLAQVAAGRMDGFFVMSLSSWDAAAGSLLVTEAGGVVCDFSGGGEFLRTNQVIAGTPAVSKALVRVLTEYAVSQ